MHLTAPPLTHIDIPTGVAHLALPVRCAARVALALVLVDVGHLRGVEHAAAELVQRVAALALGLVHGLQMDLDLAHCERDRRGGATGVSGLRAGREARSRG